MSLAERLSQAYVFIKDRVNEIQLGYKSMTIILRLVKSKTVLRKLAVAGIHGWRKLLGF